MSLQAVELTAQLRKQTEELRNHERAGIIDELRKKIAEYGLTSADLKFSDHAPKATKASQKTRKDPAAAKYQGPDGQT